MSLLMSTNLKYLKEPDLENPIAVAGLPGIGLIGKMAAEYLVDQLDAEKFAELTSDQFPGWVLRENGLVRDLKIYFFGVKTKELDRDLIIITSDAQASSPKGQYRLSEKTAEVIKSQDAETCLTMAAFLDSDDEKKDVVGAGTSLEVSEMIENNGVELLDDGRIVGMNGLLVSLSAEKGVDGFCLLGTTQGKDKDPESSENVVTKFSEIFELDLDTKDFEDELPELPKFKPPKIKMPSVSGGKKDLSYIR